MMQEIEAERTTRSICRRAEPPKLPKPLIEKKRRARINRSLTELRVLINDALKKEMQRTRTTRKSGKVEKADVLELTVRYIRDLKNQVQNSSNEMFDDGYCSCAGEVSLLLQQTLEALPDNSSLSPVLKKLKQALDNSRQQRNGAKNDTTAPQSDLSKTTLSTSFSSFSPSNTSPPSEHPLTLQQIADKACTRLLTQHLNRRYYLDQMTSTTNSSNDFPRTSLSITQKSTPVDLSLTYTSVRSPSVSSANPILTKMNIQLLPKQSNFITDLNSITKDHRFKLHQCHHHPQQSSFCKQSHSVLHSTFSSLQSATALPERSSEKIWRPW